MEGFNGFTPRTIYPNSVFGANTLNVTNLLLVVDCLQEQRIGLAPNFNPYILAQDEVMLGLGSTEYLGVQVGDKVDMEFSIELLTGANTKVNAKSDSTTPMQRLMGLLYAAAGQQLDPQIY